MALKTLSDFTPVNSNNNTTPSNNGGVSSNNSAVGLNKYIPVRTNLGDANNYFSYNNGSINIPKLSLDTKAKESEQLDVSDSQNSFLNKILDFLTPESSTLYDRVSKYENETSYNLDTFIGQFHTNRVSSRISLSANRAWSNYLDDPTEENRYYAQKLDDLTRKYQLNNQTALDDENEIAKWITKDVAQYLPQLGGQAETALPLAVAEIAVKAGIGAAKGGGIGGAIGSIIPIAGTAAGGGVGATIGAIAGTASAVAVSRVVGSGVYSYQTMRGAAFSNILNYANENGIYVSEEDARQAAQDEALVSSLIESGDKAFDVATRIPALNKIKNKATNLIASEIFKTAAGYGWNILQEGQEESFQELMSIANERRVAKGTVNGGTESLLNEFVQLCQEYFEGKQSAEISERISEAAEGGMVLGFFGGLEYGGQHILTKSVLDNITAEKISDVDTYSTEILEGMKSSLSSGGGYSATVKDSAKKIDIINNELARRDAELEKYNTVRNEIREEAKSNTNNIKNILFNDEEFDYDKATSEEAKKIIEDEAAYKEDAARRIIEDEAEARRLAVEAAEEAKNKRLLAIEEERGKEESNKQAVFISLFDELEKAFSTPYKKDAKDKKYEEKYNLATAEQRKNMDVPEYIERYIPTRFTSSFDRFLGSIKIYKNENGKKVHLKSKDVYNLLKRFNEDKSKLTSAEKDALLNIINKYSDIIINLSNNISELKNRYSKFMELGNSKLDDFIDSISKSVTDENGIETYEFSKDDLAEMLFSFAGEKREAIKNEFSRRESVNNLDTYTSDEVNSIYETINNLESISRVNNVDIIDSVIEYNKAKSNHKTWKEEKITEFSDKFKQIKFDYIYSKTEETELPKIDSISNLYKDIELTDSEKESIEHQVDEYYKNIEEIYNNYINSVAIKNHKEFISIQDKLAKNDSIENICDLIVNRFGNIESLFNYEVIYIIKKEIKYIDKKGNFTSLGKELFDNRIKYLSNSYKILDDNYTGRFYDEDEIKSAATKYVIYSQDIIDRLSEEKYMLPKIIVSAYRRRYNFNGNVPRTDLGELYGSVEWEYAKSPKVYLVDDLSEGKTIVVIDRIKNGANELSKYAVANKKGKWKANAGYKLKRVYSTEDLNSAIEYVFNEDSDVSINDISSLLIFHSPYRFFESGDKSGTTYSENQLDKRKIKDKEKLKRLEAAGIEYSIPIYIKAPNEYLNVSKEIFKLCLDEYNKSKLSKIAKVKRASRSLVSKVFSKISDNSEAINNSLRKAVIKDLEAMKWDLFEFDGNRYVIKNVSDIQKLNAINQALRLIGSKEFKNLSEEYEENKILTDEFILRKNTAGNENLEPTESDYKLVKLPIIRLGYLSKNIESNGEEISILSWLNNLGITKENILDMKFGEDKHIIKSQLLNGKGMFSGYTLDTRKSIAEAVYSKEFTTSKKTDAETGTIAFSGNKTSGELIEAGSDDRTEESYIDWSPTAYLIENYAEYANEGNIAEDINSAIKFFTYGETDENFNEDVREFIESIKSKTDNEIKSVPDFVNFVKEQIVEYYSESLEQRLSDINTELEINIGKKEYFSNILEKYMESSGVSTILKLYGKIKKSKGNLAEISEDLIKLTELSFNREVSRKNKRKEMKDSSLERRGFSYPSGESDISSSKINGVVGRIDKKNNKIIFNNRNKRKFSIKEKGKDAEFLLYDALDIEDILSPEAEYYSNIEKENISHYENLIKRVFKYITDNTGIVEINGKIYSDPKEIFDDVFNYANELNKIISNDKKLDEERKNIALSFNISKKKKTNFYDLYMNGVIGDELLTDYLFDQLSEIYSPKAINNIAKISDIFSKRDNSVNNLDITIKYLSEIKDTIIETIMSNDDISIKTLKNIEKSSVSELRLIKDSDTIEKITPSLIEARFNKISSEIENEIQFRKHSRFNRAMKFIVFASKLNQLNNSGESFDSILGAINDVINLKNSSMPQGESLPFVPARNGKQEYVIFDLEANGLEYDSEIFQIGAIKIINGKKVDEFKRIIKINEPLSENVKNLTGKDDSYLKSGVSINEALKDFYDFIGDNVLVAHNFEAYDGRLLQRDFNNILGKNIENDYVDTLQFARLLRPGEPNSQNSLARMLNLEEESHDAYEDANQLISIYEYLEKYASNKYKKEGGLEGYSLEFLDKDKDIKSWINALKVLNLKSLDSKLFAYNKYFKNSKSKKIKNKIDNIIKEIDGIKESIANIEKELSDFYKESIGLACEIKYKDGHVEVFDIDKIPSKISKDEEQNGRTFSSKRLLVLKENYERTNKYIESLIRKAKNEHLYKSWEIYNLDKSLSDSEKEARRQRFLKYEETDTRKRIIELENRLVSNKKSFNDSIEKEIIRTNKLEDKYDDILERLKNKKQDLINFGYESFSDSENIYGVSNKDIYDIASGNVDTSYYDFDTYTNSDFSKAKSRSASNILYSHLSKDELIKLTNRAKTSDISFSRPVIVFDKYSNEVEGNKYRIEIKNLPYFDVRNGVVYFLDSDNINGATYDEYYREDSGSKWERELKNGIIPKEWEGVMHEKFSKYSYENGMLVLNRIYTNDIFNINNKKEELSSEDNFVEKNISLDNEIKESEQSLEKPKSFVKEYIFSEDDISPNSFISRITSAVLNGKFDNEKSITYSGYTISIRNIKEPGYDAKAFLVKDKNGNPISSFSKQWLSSEDISKSDSFRMAVTEVSNIISKAIASVKKTRERYSYSESNINLNDSKMSEIIGEDNLEIIKKLADEFGNGTLSEFLHNAKTAAINGTSSIDGLEKFCNTIIREANKSEDIIYTKQVVGIADEILRYINKMRESVNDYNSMKNNKDIGKNERDNALYISSNNVLYYQTRISERVVDLYSSISKRDYLVEKYNNRRVDALTKTSKFSKIKQNFSSLMWKQMRPDNALYSLGGFRDFEGNEMYELARKIDKALIKEQVLSVKSLSKLNDAVKSIPRGWLKKHYNDGIGIKLKLFIDERSSLFDSENSKYTEHELTVNEALLLMHTIQSINKKTLEYEVSDVGISFKEKDGTIVFISNEDVNWKELNDLLFKKFPKGSEVRTIFEAGKDCIVFINKETEQVAHDVTGVYPYLENSGAIPITFIDKSGTYASNNRPTDRKSHPNSILDYYKLYRDESSSSEKYIRIWDYSSTLKNRIKEGVQYASWAEIATEFDIRNRSLKDDKSGNGFRSLSEIARDSLGNAAADWFDNYIEHMLMYSDSTTQFDGFLNAILSAQQGAWLTGNPGVIVKQFTNYFSALDKISIDSLIGGMAYKLFPKINKKIKNVLSDKSMTASALLAHRKMNNEMSDFSVTFGNGLAAKIHNSSSMKFLQSLIGKMDEKTEEMHLAASYIQAAKEVGIDSDKLDSRAEEIYSQVILKNSPIYISRNRSEYARNTKSQSGSTINVSAFERALGMFRTALDQFWNNEYKAKMEYKVAKENNDSSVKTKKKELNKILLGNSLSALSYAIITVAYSILKTKGKYKNDEDEPEYDKIIREIVYNYIMARANNTFMLGDVTELGLKIGGKFINVDFGEYYSNENSPLTEVYNSMDNIWSYAKSPNPTTLKNMVNSIMTIYPGISINNAYSIVNMIMIDISNLTGENPDKYTDILKKYQGETPSSKKSMSENASILIKAYTRDDISKELSSYAYLELSDGDYEAAIKNKVKDYYMDNKLDDKQARELLDKYYNSYKDESRKSDNINKLLYTWKLEREYGISYDKVDDLLRTGVITHSDFVKIKVGYGIDKEDAESEANVCDFERIYPEYEGIATSSFVRNWNDYYSQWGIPVEIAYAFWDAKENEITSDRNEYGYSMSNKQDKVIEYIDSLPITSEQKTYLFYNLYSNSKSNSKK